MGRKMIFMVALASISLTCFSQKNMDQSTKENLVKAVKNLQDPEFETMVRVNNKDERTRVMVKIKEDTIREMVVVTTNGNEKALIRIKGKISPSDVEKLVKEHTNG